MDAFVKLSTEDRRIFFEGAAAPLNLAPLMVEKHFWVCWTLKEFFLLPVMGEHLIFKAGTSLSKVFKVIERFSEDIDVSIDRGFLGFDGPNEAEAGASNMEKQRTKKLAKEGNLKPAEEKAAQEKLLAGGLTERERLVLAKGISNAEFHYLGSAKTLGGDGKGLAEAMAGLNKTK